mgnify:CR=1 FL=1|jgi:hypothetical protein|tara:strand:- start:227 stop:415 length:189 start_codon:yes stop_codon:yes gene_type:complete
MSDDITRKDYLRLEALRLAVHGASESTMLKFDDLANRYYEWLINEPIIEKKTRKVSSKQVLK